MIFLKILWRGEIPLGRTYWVFGGLFLSLLIIPGYFIDPTISGSANLEPSASFVFGTMAYAIFTLAYIVFISVAIWRSAGRYEGPAIWAVLARIMVVIGLIQTAFQIAAA